MRWQKEQMQPLGNHEVTTLVPTCLIHHQQNVRVWPTSLFLGEGAEGEREGLRIDSGHKQPRSLSALWLDKPVEVHPLIARSDDCLDAAPFARPDPAQDRFETDAMLILTPPLNLSLWILLLQLLDLLWEFFLKPAAWLHRSAHAAGVAHACFCLAAASNPSLGEGPLVVPDARPSRLPRMAPLHKPPSAGS
jgi:hypothetical protein